MSERVQDYVVDYSVTKLEETARTFRRLGEAYENASEPQKAVPEFPNSFFSCGCTGRMYDYVCAYGRRKKDFVRELTRKCFVNGIRIKNVQHLSKKMAEMPLCFRQGLWAEAVWQQKSCSGAYRSAAERILSG